MNPTRNSKIARLPRPVREELNQRLDNGEMAQQLVEWLNALPEVQTILATHFGGRAITEQNLSVWKQGGYEDWQRHEEAREWVGRVMEEAGELATASTRTRLADHVAIQVLMELAKMLQKAMALDDSTEQRKAVLGIAQQLTQLRRADHQAEQVQMQKERMEMKREEVRKQQRKEEKTAAAGATIRADFHIDEYGRPTRTGEMDPGLRACFALNARLRREAGLPVNFPAFADPEPQAQATQPSEAIQPNPSQSNL